MQFFYRPLRCTGSPAHQSAAAVHRQIDQYGLAEIFDTIEPIGSIMAGDWQRNMPWCRKKDRVNKSDEAVA